MKVIKGTEDVSPEDKGAFITIGNFDGVHLGHQQVFQRLIHEAHEEKRQALLVTFVPHPKIAMHPERRPFYLLTTLEEKIKLLAELGLDAVILISFTIEYAATTAEELSETISYYDCINRELLPILCAGLKNPYNMLPALVYLDGIVHTT